MKSSSILFEILSIITIIVIGHHQQVSGQKGPPAPPAPPQLPPPALLPGGYEDYDTGLDHGSGNQPSQPVPNENFSGELASPVLTDAGGSAEIDGDPDGAGGPARTRFSDQRFARLFPSRVNRPGSLGRSDLRLMPKEVARPKPTLPSFIKGTPPTIKVQITTPATTGRFNIRHRSAPTLAPRNKPSALLAASTTTSTTTARPLHHRNRASSSSSSSSGRHQSGTLTGRLPSTVKPPASTTVPPALTGAAGRRRFNSGSNRFQSSRSFNQTIPALNPRRN